MKKTIALLATLAISTSAFAQKVVPIIWPFSIASSQSNLVRSTIDNANTQQSKYQFVFQSKPGAGGAIAATAAIDSKELVVLATSTSFYIRPLLYKDNYNVDELDMLAPLCNAQPLAIYSKKFNKLTDAPHKELSIGVVPGSITTLLLRTLKRENPEIKILEVPYKGTPEATSDMLGGHIDGNVDFIGNSVTSRFGSDIKVFGITGTRNVGNFSTFQSMKIKGLEKMTADFFFLVNKSVDDTTKQELYKILTNALTEKTKTICEDDFGHLVKTPYNQLDSIHRENKLLWKKFTVGIPKE